MHIFINFAVTMPRLLTAALLEKHQILPLTVVHIVGKIALFLGSALSSAVSPCGRLVVNHLVASITFSEPSLIFPVEGWLHDSAISGR